MKRADRPILVAALTAQLPPGWTARECGVVILVRGPKCPEDHDRNEWTIGTGPPCSYPSGQNVIERFEPNVGSTVGFHVRHADLRGRRGWRDLIVSEMLRIIANPPPTSRQRVYGQETR